MGPIDEIDSSVRRVSDDDLDRLVMECASALGLAGLRVLYFGHASPVSPAQGLSLALEVQELRRRLAETTGPTSPATHPTARPAVGLAVPSAVPPAVSPVAEPQPSGVGKQR